MSEQCECEYLAPKIWQLVLYAPQGVEKVSDWSWPAGGDTCYCEALWVLRERHCINILFIFIFYLSLFLGMFGEIVISYPYWSTADLISLNVRRNRNIFFSEGFFEIDRIGLYFTKSMFWRANGEQIMCSMSFHERKLSLNRNNWYTRPASIIIIIIEL